MSTLIKILSATIIIAAPALADYQPEEMCVIPWGDSAGQLGIRLPHYEYDIDGETGVIDSGLWESGGPTDIFIDKDENVYVSSYDLNYFKIFNNRGNLIGDLSPKSPKYSKSLYYERIGGFCVDSLLRIYIMSIPERTYIAVTDTSGTLIERLYPPCGEDSLRLNADVTETHEAVAGFEYGANDVLTFLCWTSGMYTYKSREFYPGGALSCLGIDGNYYAVGLANAKSIHFKKYGNPDLQGNPGWVEENDVIFMGNLTTASLLALDNNLNLYIDYFEDSKNEGGVLVYDSTYNYIDKLILPVCHNKYMTCLGEFYRQDGNIYEFRCLDDGLHVIRWSRK